MKVKVQVCTGARCTYYGANSILDSLDSFKEELHKYEQIPDDAEVEIEVLECQNYCKEDGHRPHPVVYVDGQLVKDAKASKVTAEVFNKLKED